MKPLYINGREVLNLPEQVEKNRKDIEDIVAGNFHLYRHHIELRDGVDFTAGSLVIELDIISKSATITLDEVKERCRKPICATGRYAGDPVVSIMYVDNTYEIYYLSNAELARTTDNLEYGNTYTEEIL